VHAISLPIAHNAPTKEASVADQFIQMKRIEDVILETSTEVKAKLYLPAKKAFDAPDTGVTIVKPAAYKVIKDCAETTLLFLPIEIFLKFKNPIQSLRGKFVRDQIIDLYNRTISDSVAKILFQLILDTCPKSAPSLVPVNPTAILSHIDSEDPYGTYGDTAPAISEELKSSIDVIVAAYS